MESGKLMQPLCSVDIYMLHLYQDQMIWIHWSPWIIKKIQEFGQENDK